MPIRSTHGRTHRTGLYTLKHEELVYGKGRGMPLETNCL